MKLKLNSEYGRLKAVITHRPGKEIERLTPSNTSELLFEDVPYLEGMQKEHDEFTSLIRDSIGAKVYRLHDLLVEVMIDQNLKDQLFDASLAKMDSVFLKDDILARYSTAECAKMLIAGIKVKELKRKINGAQINKLDGEAYIINPSPNLYFMRDPAAIVQDGVICSHMKFSGRQGESNLLKTIFSTLILRGHLILFIRSKLKVQIFQPSRVATSLCYQISLLPSAVLNEPMKKQLN
jgi:arginine deiminase